MRRAINYFRFYTRSYCRIRYILSNNINVTVRENAAVCLQNRSNTEIIKLKFSTLPSSRPTHEKKDIKDLLQEYPQPKAIIQRFITKMYLVSGGRNIEPTLTIEQQKLGGDDLFHAHLTLYWPEKFQVEGEALRKSEAEKIAYLYACQKLKEYGVLDNENKPILPRTKYNEDWKTAKSVLCGVFDIIWPKVGSRDLMPLFETTLEKGPFDVKNIWKTKLTIKYPEEKVFHAISLKSTEAERIAAFGALKWLQGIGIIDENKQPIFHSREDVLRILAHENLPVPLQTLEKLPKMALGMDKYNVFKIDNRNLYADCMQDAESIPETEDPMELDIITEKPYRSLTEEETKSRSQELYQNQLMLKSNTDPELVKLLETRLSFPIAEQRELILQLIENNPVVVVSGETGCGKSTQVPQYIFDYFISKYKGSECSIVVTQPRRISAITIAEFVAAERGEQVGQTIGHQIRLNRLLPKDSNGSILFCTTGILLKKLSTNPDLKGISHVIVDEVHERTVQIDFLLILLKNLLERNKDIKLIIMSATFNTSLISQYFGGCPIIDIPGKIYPVEEHYLDKFAEDINYRATLSLKPRLNVDLLSKVICHVDATQPPGSILCFLPGWHEIKEVHFKLGEHFAGRSKHKVFLLHSRLSPNEQKRVFMPPEDGVRKIILSTNVAECSITINDVVYVIDCGLHKQTVFDSGTGTSALDLQWISKANVKQRRGRAGRTQPGICYFVYPQKVFQKMQEYPLPEMRRISLENVVLNCKIHCPNERAEEFLSQAPEHPDSASIRMGIEELFMMGVLNQNENLTTLGKIVGDFATHPRLSKTLVVATFLRCIDPILTIAAFLTIVQDPFVGALDRRKQIKKIKRLFDESTFSDHIAVYNLFCKWDSLNHETLEEERLRFIESAMLDEDTLIYIKQLKTLFAESLYNAGLVDSPSFCTDLSSKLNQNSKTVEVVLAALTAGFYPNVAKIIEGKVSEKKIYKDAIHYKTVQNKPALPQTQSVVSKNYYLPSPYLVYFSALKSEARLCLLLSAVSPVPGISFPLFAGKDLVLKTKSEPGADPEDEVVMCVDDSKKLTFVCSGEEAQMIANWRQCLLEFFQIFLKSAQQKETENFILVNDFLDSELLPILKEVLEMPQVPFTAGKKYVRLNGKIISEDL